MSQDPEKRFHSIMDKLFQSNKSSSSSGQRQPFRGIKRPNPSSEDRQQYCLVAGEAPLCRPWDRGDLLKRLSTFKSMTWFAKPKVVDAVNCATRGWVNVDTDIIACESCGARLLFSTPPSWSREQVEKAALVFSLKLDSGHKLLCPWIDNACDERLAEFPPTMPADLVDKFRERSNLLLQLLALPVISPSAIELMRRKSPQLEEFLRQPLMVNTQEGNAGFSQLESIEDVADVDSAKLYYQALKLISLCGWEPRSLPYVVDCKDGQNQFVKDADILNSSRGVDNGRNLTLSFHATDENENLEANKDFENSFRLQYDPQSVVLDCRLCGASVGLWAFSAVQRPIEFLRLVGSTEVNPGVRDSGHESNASSAIVAIPSNGGSSSMEQSSNLKLTIAGGPPATQQNFKATISLPVIGRSLRARLSYHPEFRDQMHNNQGDYVSEEVVVEDVRTLNSKKDDQPNCDSTSQDQSPCPKSNLDVSARDDTFRNLTPLEGTDFTIEEISPHTGTDDFNVGDQIESFLNVVQGSCQSNNFPEKVDDNRSGNLAVKDSDALHVGESVITEDANDSSRNARTRDNDSSVMATFEKCHPIEIAETDKFWDIEICLSSHQESTSVASCLEADVNVDGTYKMNSKGNKICSNSKEGMTSIVQTAQNNKVLACSKGKDLKELDMDKMSGFDPIRQHRHFCSWIAMGSRAPGWEQTLSALLCGKDSHHSSPTSSPSSASMIKVDDPIASVRKLFTSPTAKKTKITGESS
ncbi:hypothetical protein PTKIN_Ptkin04bG0002900 [Pterospermum kingtungense]